MTKQPQDVQDKKAEFRINVNNYLQSILVIATIGFGTKIVSSIDALTLGFNTLVTTTTINTLEIQHLKDTDEEAKKDREKIKADFSELRNIIVRREK